jgi:membrane associated rhomboid family serine protease
MTRPPAPFNTTSEPLFLVPVFVPAFAGLFVVIHALLELGPQEWKGLAYAFLPLAPARFTNPEFQNFPLGVAELATHGFIHANWFHVLLNSALLLAATGPVYRNAGPTRTVALFLVCVIAGGLFHLAAYWGQPVVALGASGGIGGMLAAAMRIRMRQLSRGEILAPLRQREVMSLTIFWIGINLAFFLWDRIGGGAVSGLATMAHIGGYLAGLFGIPFFMRGKMKLTIVR